MLLHRNLCLNTAFRCQSYDYNATGAQVCRLSHHSSLTLTQIREPFLAVPDASTKELSACYNVSVDCRAGDMIATVRTSKIFQGKLYAKGAPNSCALDVQNALEFALRLPYTDLECGVQREAMGRYSTEVWTQKDTLQYIYKYLLFTFFPKKNLWSVFCMDGTVPDVQTICAYFYKFPFRKK